MFEITSKNLFSWLIKLPCSRYLSKEVKIMGEMLEGIKSTSDKKKDFLKKNKKITFITGSNSSTIPTILQVPERHSALVKKPALIPTGLLLKHNIIPFNAGELGSGINNNGVNQTKLSGMEFGGLETCIWYASTQGINNLDANDPLKPIRKICQKKEDLYFFEIFNLRLAALRLLLLGVKNEMCNEAKTWITNLQNVQSIYRSEIQEILTLFDIVKPFNLTQKDIQLIRNPFPIVWGSMSLEPDVYENASVLTGTPGEHTIEKVAFLGDDIQIAFTEKSKEKLLQNILKVHDVSVYNFEDARKILTNNKDLYLLRF